MHINTGYPDQPPFCIGMQKEANTVINTTSIIRLMHLFHRVIMLSIRRDNPNIYILIDIFTELLNGGIGISLEDNSLTFLELLWGWS